MVLVLSLGDLAVRHALQPLDHLLVVWVVALEVAEVVSVHLDIDHLPGLEPEPLTHEPQSDVHGVQAAAALHHFQQSAEEVEEARRRSPVVDEQINHFFQEDDCLAHLRHLTEHRCVHRVKTVDELEYGGRQKVQHKLASLQLPVLLEYEEEQRLAGVEHILQVQLAIPHRLQEEDLALTRGRKAAKITRPS